MQPSGLLDKECSTFLAFFGRHHQKDLGQTPLSVKARPFRHMAWQSAALACDALGLGGRMRASGMGIKIARFGMGGRSSLLLRQSLTWKLDDRSSRVSPEREKKQRRLI